MVIYLGSLFLALGLINFDFRRGWWAGQWRRLVIGYPIIFIYVYETMPPFVFPQAITLLLLTLIPNAIYTFMLAARSVLVTRRLIAFGRTPILPYLAACAVVGGYAGFLQIMPVVNAGGLRDLAGVTQTNSAPPDADLEHVRVVPIDSARFAGDKVIGQLGTYYHVGDYNVQLAQGKLVWVTALEFHDPIQWIFRRTSPGVIIVSAENPDAGAELRQRTPMRYISSAFLNDNLYRHVYMTYGDELILETTLQLDDNGDPKELATLGRPTIGWSGEQVTAVVIVDPASGEMQRIPRDQFDMLPKWISRVYPPDLALDYNDWFGRYVHGFWNSIFAKRDVHLPARGEVTGLSIGRDRFVWFVDHTSPSATDASMTGFTYMDSRSGAMTYYTASGGEFSSTGSENAVAANPLVRQGRLLPTQPILYNVFGQNTWVVPVIADNGKYQTLALVQATNGRVVVGNASAPSASADAFDSYRDVLGGRAVGGPVSAPVSGIVDRLAPSGAALYFTLRGNPQIYVLRDASPGALLMRTGDHVNFVVQGTETDAARAGAFKNLSLH